MKKIVLFIGLCLMPLIGLAQDGESHHYINVKINNLTTVFHNSNSYKPFGSIVGTGTFGIGAELPLCRQFYLTLEGFIGMGFGYGDIYTPAMLGVGLKTFINDRLYVSAAAYPRIKIVGDGHQVYGDYMTGWITFVPAFGYRYSLNSEHILFAEAGLSIDATIFSTIGARMDNCGLFLTVGYSYVID